MKNFLKINKPSRTSIVMDALLPKKASKLTQLKKTLKHVFRKRVDIKITFIK